jgi:hypothetical protein
LVEAEVMAALDDGPDRAYVTAAYAKLDRAAQRRKKRDS